MAELYRKIWLLENKSMKKTGHFQNNTSEEKPAYLCCHQNPIYETYFFDCCRNSFPCEECHKNACRERVPPEYSYLECGFCGCKTYYTFNPNFKFHCIKCFRNKEIKSEDFGKKKHFPKYLCKHEGDLTFTCCSRVFRSKGYHDRASKHVAQTDEIKCRMCLSFQSRFYCEEATQKKKINQIDNTKTIAERRSNNLYKRKRPLFK